MKTGMETEYIETGMECASRWMTMEQRQPSLNGVSTASEFSSAEREAGRLLFAQPWDFATAASSLESLPKMRGIEIAFAGRSNVGKSSLINALTGRNALARTSHTPGRTQELIFFAADPNLTLVDMPGYGYAAAPKDIVKAWTKLIHDYLLGRANLARVYVLIDARHGIKEVDQDVLKTLDKSAVSYQVVLTKADQVKAAELEKHIGETTAALAKHPAAFPEVLVTSSRSGAGMAELRAAMVRLLRERA
jgi:GTP-binding protein